MAQARPALRCSPVRASRFLASPHKKAVRQHLARCALNPLTPLFSVYITAGPVPCAFIIDSADSRIDELAQRPARLSTTKRVPSLTSRHFTQRYESKALPSRHPGPTHQSSSTRANVRSALDHVMARDLELHSKLRLAFTRLGFVNSC